MSGILRLVYRFALKIKSQHRNPDFQFIEFLKSLRPKNLKYLFKRFIAKAPRNICIETDTGCNRDCEYCPVGNIERDNTSMDFKKYTSFVDDLSQAGFIGSIAFHRFNEPLLDERLPEFIEYANYMLDNAYLVVITNGDFLDKGKLLELYRAGTDIVSISLHGGRKDKKETFEKVKKALDKLKEKNKMAIEIKENIKNTEEHYFKFASIAGYQGRLKIHFNVPDNYKNFSNRGGKIELDEVKEKDCRIYSEGLTGIMTLEVTPSGNVLLCCDQFSSDYGPVFGNVFQHNFLDVWNSPRFAKVRKELKEDRVPEYKCCQNCAFGKFNI